MAGTVPNITNITDVKMPDSARPVFFVKLQPRLPGAGSWDLVVKGENPSDSASEQDCKVSIQWGAKLMKNVTSNLVNTKNMGPSEIQVFKAAATRKYPNPGAERKQVDSAYLWTKMLFVQGLEGADAYDEEVGKYDLDKVKKIILKMLDETVWRDLGKIVAVDIFNGNDDRFKLGSPGTEAGDWANRGNVLFVAGAKSPVVGLDTYDARNAGSNFMATPNDLTYLRPLIDAGARLKFAQTATTSVGTTLQSDASRSIKGKGMASFAMLVIRPDGQRDMVRIEIAKMGELFTPYANSFSDGIKLGSDELKRYLQDKVRQYGGVAVPPPRPNTPPPIPGQTPPTGRPLMGGHRLPPLPPVPPGRTPPNKPLPPIPGKQIPEGILARMRYLGWL